MFIIVGLVINRFIPCDKSFRKSSCPALETCSQSKLFMKKSRTWNRLYRNGYCNIKGEVNITGTKTLWRKLMCFLQRTDTFWNLSGKGGRTHRVVDRAKEEVKTRYRQENSFKNRKMSFDSFFAPCE